MQKKSLLYLTNNYQNTTQAQFINSTSRIKVLKDIGLAVSMITNTENLFSLIQKVRSAHYIYIRIDGSGILDKYSLLKLFNPNCKIIWEIHGSQTEKILHSNSRLLPFFIVKDKLKRKILSSFVNSYIFISKELQEYCFEQKEIRKNNYQIIPNFIDNKSITHTTKNNILNPDLFKVIWIGNPFFKWHATNLIETIAKKIYKKDTDIIFIVTGGESWHNINWQKNLLVIEPIENEELKKYVNASDICLALYNKNQYFPLYFSPLKILEYMIYKKPVIATNTKTISEMITDRENGFLTNNSINSIIKTILMLKKNTKLRKSIGMNAFKTAQQKFGVKQAAQQYTLFFKSL